MHTSTYWYLYVNVKSKKKYIYIRLAKISICIYLVIFINSTYFRKLQVYTMLHMKSILVSCLLMCTYYKYPILQIPHLHSYTRGREHI